MVGVGGTFVFKFSAAKAGKTEVNLEYVRPWEKNKKPVKTFTATIEVEEK
jgi:inhibitor of cysteine peptidase